MENEIQNQNLNTTQPQPVQPPVYKTGGGSPLNLKWLKIGVGFAILVILLGGVYALGKNNTNPKPATITKDSVSTPTSTPAPDPTADWKTYNSSTGYSIKFPANWEVQQFNENASENNNTWVTNFEAIPPNEPKVGNDSFSVGPIVYRDANGKIYKTVASLNEIKAHWEEQNYPLSWFIKTTTTTTKVNGFDAVIKEAIWKSTPPADFAGEWSDSTDKEIYIDLKNGTIIKVTEHLANSKPKNKTTSNQILSTFKFTADTSTSKTYNALCGFSVNYPSDWKIQKYFVVDSEKQCAYTTAPNYTEGTDSRVGFYLGITRIKIGSTTSVNGKVPIYTLEDYIKDNESIISPSTMSVSEKVNKTYGKINGISYLPFGYEPGRSFIFINNGYIYNVNWNNELEEQYTSEINQIISSIKFN